SRLTTCRLAVKVRLGEIWKTISPIYPHNKKLGIKILISQINDEIALVQFDHRDGPSLSSVGAERSPSS
ncbi:MAG: hypothetical protein ABL878_15765, partial [Burkholderiales bacterium]